MTRVSSSGALRLHWASMAVLLLGSACSSSGGSGEESDPLPTGVVAEMGSRRWHHESPVGRLAFARAGAVLLSGGRESVRAWDAASGRLLATIDRRPSPPPPLIEKKEGVVEAVISSKGKWLSIAFSPDGNHAAIQEKGILLLDLAARKLQATFDLGNGSAGPAAFSPDGKQLAAISWDGTLHLLDVAAAKEAAAYRVYDAPLRGELLCLEFSPDGKWIAASDMMNQLFVWDSATGKQVFEVRKRVRYKSLAFSPDGGRLAAGGDDRKIRLWDFRRGTETAALEGPEESEALAFSPGGDLLLAGEYGDRICLWDLSSGKERWSAGLTDHLGALTISPDGRQALVAGYGGRIARWDVATGKKFRLPGHDREIVSLQYSPDGLTLLSASKEGRVCLWESGSGRKRWEAAEGGPCLAALFSPDGNTIALSRKEGTIQFLDAATGRLRRSFGCDHGDTAVLAYMPGSIVSGCAKGFLHFWDPTRAQEQRSFASGEELFHALAPSPDGSCVAAAGRPDALVLWDSRTGKELFRQQDKSSWLGGALNQIAWSSDGRKVATGRWMTVILRDGVSGQELWSLSPSKEEQKDVEPITSLRFRSADRLLFGKSREFTMVDLAARRPIRKQPVTDGVAALAVSPDGQRCATGGQTGVILEWSLPE